MRTAKKTNQYNNDSKETNVVNELWLLEKFATTPPVAADDKYQLAQQLFATNDPDKRQKAIYLFALATKQGHKDATHKLERIAFNEDSQAAAEALYQWANIYDPGEEIINENRKLAADYAELAVRKFDYEIALFKLRSMAFSTLNYLERTYQKNGRTYHDDNNAHIISLARAAKQGDTESLEFLMGMANSNYFIAQFALGCLYDKGMGQRPRQPKLKEAAKWYRSSIYQMLAKTERVNMPQDNDEATAKEAAAAAAKGVAAAAKGVVTAAKGVVTAAKGVADEEATAEAQAAAVAERAAAVTEEDEASWSFYPSQASCSYWAPYPQGPQAYYSSQASCSSQAPSSSQASCSSYSRNDDPKQHPKQHGRYFAPQNTLNRLNSSTPRRT